MDGGGTDWNTALLEVSDDLDSRDTRSLQYLSQAEIGNPDFEKKRDSLDIFHQLSHLKDKETVKHVRECLYLMEKFSLIRKLGLNKEELENQIKNSDTVTISPFRKALFNISKELSTAEVNRMIELSNNGLKNFSIRRLERIDESARIFELFNILEQRKDISSNDTTFLTTLFEEIHRKDLFNHLEPFTKGGLKPIGIYPVNTESPGLCIILNNEKFEDTEKFHERLGSQSDVESITKLFDNLGYKIIVKSNLRSGDIVDFVHRLKTEDHGVYTSFVFFILSHGGPRMIYGVDGLPVQISKLTEEFTASSCKTLAGKPKVFFIQACQGKKEQLIQTRASPRCLRVVRSDIVPMPPVQDEPLDDMMHPNPSDFLLGFSTAPGYISYRDSRSGSFYIQSLCRQIQEKCKRTVVDDQQVPAIPDLYNIPNEELTRIKVSAKSSGNFAAALTKRFFPELYGMDNLRYFYNWNGGGKHGKRELDPARREIIHQFTVRMYPEVRQEDIFRTNVINAVNEMLRRQPKKQRPALAAVQIENNPPEADPHYQELDFNAL